MGTPRATRPVHWAACPRQTFAPSSAMPGGARPPAAWKTSALPRLAATLAPCFTALESTSAASRARSEPVTTYKSSRYAARNSLANFRWLRRWNRAVPTSEDSLAATMDSCCPSEDQAGGSGSPCSTRSPWQVLCALPHCLPHPTKDCCDARTSL